MISTVNKMKPAIGMRGYLIIEELSIAVKIVDMRTRWGKVDAQIEPIAGCGKKWVEANRIVLDTAPKGWAHVEGGLEIAGY